MNKVILMGRLTKDPDLRYGAGEGKAVCKFTIAANRPMEKDKADFISCTAFGKRAETIAQYFLKGNLILLEGSIRTGSYEDKEGNKRYTTEVYVSNFEFLTSSGARTNNQNNDNPFDDITPSEDGECPF